MPVEQIRTFLFVSLLFVLFLMWQAWQQDYGPRPGDAPSTVAGTTPTAPITDAPPQVDTLAGAPPPPLTTPPTAPALPDTPGAAAEAGVVTVETDLLTAELDPGGLGIRLLTLTDYPESLDQPDHPVKLLNAQAPQRFVAQSPLLGSNTELTDRTALIPEQHQYTLADDQDELSVKFSWTSPKGLAVAKTYIFHRGSYRVDVIYQVRNDTGAPWAARLYGVFRRPRPLEEGGLFRLPTYTGGVISNDATPYEKIDFDDMAARQLNITVTGGWVAMIQHYFASAWIPDFRTQNRYYARPAGDLYELGVSTDHRLAPGETGTFRLAAYLGPKLQDEMEAVAPRLRLTVDYGWLTFLSQPLFWLLDWIHSVLGNWGWSIVVLTIFVKVLFLWPSAASYRSMAKMRKLQPRLVQLRETYGSDKARMNQKMMELYKEEKINPLGGCLPILIQIPVFIALYWVLLESVELRQADFMLWLDDLSTYDPYFVLPILMGLTMLLQQKLNPTPPDPIQAKVMMALPFVFTFFFLFFPSGLVLYWFVNNVLSIGQQWIITKQIAPETT